MSLNDLGAIGVVGVLGAFRVGVLCAIGDVGVLK